MGMAGITATSPPKVILEERITTLMAENALACFVYYYLHNAHYRRVQSFSRGLVYYIHTAVPHASYTLNCTVLFPQIRNLHLP